MPCNEARVVKEFWDDLVKWWQRNFYVVIIRVVNTVVGDAWLEINCWKFACVAAEPA
jgi:hypothetical protein